MRLPNTKRIRFIIKLAIIIVMLIVVGGHQTRAISDNGSLEIKNNSLINNNLKQKAEVFVFIRKGCNNCKKEENFLLSNETIKDNAQVKFLDIDQKDNKEAWQKVINKHKLSKVTPITLVGGNILIGFNEKTTGRKILDSLKEPKQSYGLVHYLGEKNEDGLVEDGENYSCNVDNVATCSLDKNNTANGVKAVKENNIMMLPYFGKIDVKKASLIIMSSVLGFIDGFNPCAMWVLLTFLIILSQMGKKRKMIYLAGLFIIAEAVMYFLILNVWYQTWDFIKLDRFVTPIVGLIAVGGGIYFLYKYYKNKDGKLTCEVTSVEHQQKTVAKIKEVVTKPITIITTLTVLAIAFSVNIIEFACSVGIAQSFTKILELNELSFVLRQWYIFVYTLFYMADDFLIFGLAIFGYQKFTAVGAKYSHLSGLFGGILMIILGILLILNPVWF